MNDLTNQPAFPGITESFAASDPDDQQPFTGLFTYSGMTYRQWLAGLAMQGISSNPELYRDIKERCNQEDGVAEPEMIARFAAMQADALIAQIEKPTA